MEPLTTNILNEILSALLDLGIPQNLLKENSCFKKDIQLDSVETVQLAMSLKKRLNVTVRISPKEELTIADLVNLIEKQLIK